MYFLNEYIYLAWSTWINALQLSASAKVNCFMRCWIGAFWGEPE